MIIAASYLEIDTEECQSLKEKRSIVRSIKDRLKQKYNVSVAEVGTQNDWHQSIIGVAFVSSSQSHANSVSSKILDFIEDSFPGRLKNYQLDFISYSIND